jgi:hypothetical protein
MVVKKESTVHTCYKTYVVWRQMCDYAFDMVMEMDLEMHWTTSIGYLMAINHCDNV